MIGSLSEAVTVALQAVMKQTCESMTTLARCRFGLVAMIGATSSLGLAQSRPPAFTTSRENENYSSLASQELKGLAALKYIPLGKGRYLSLGGEIRERYERIVNENWGAIDTDINGNNLTRTLLHFDLHLDPGLRIFTQFQDSRITGNDHKPRAVDRDAFDVLQLFADVTVPSSASKLNLRAGRQELAYGSGRLLFLRELVNTRASYDGARLQLRAPKLDADAFVVQPVETDPGILDNGPVKGETLAGIYTTLHPSAAPLSRGLDLYYLYFRRANGQFQQGKAEERRHTLGARSFAKSSTFDYTAEGIAQTGAYGNGKVAAWNFSTEVGYRFKDAKFKPRVALRANYVTGDRDPANPNMEGFNSIVPKGPNFGEMILIGPYNIIDLHPMVTFGITPKLDLILEHDSMWRQSRGDGVYNPLGVLVRKGSATDGRFIGTWLGLTGNYRATRFTTVYATIGRFTPGSFLSNPGPNRPIDYSSVFVAYRF